MTNTKPPPKANQPLTKDKVNKGQPTNKVTSTKNTLFSTNPFQDQIKIDNVASEENEKLGTTKLHAFILLETIAICFLTMAFVFAQPLYQPRYVFNARTPDNKLINLVGLPFPNMTNHAVIAWASSSITELMTFGFGDLDSKLLMQKQRFTKDGWDAFVHAFLNAKTGEKFKKNMLVLTTVPSDTAIIISQGFNKKQVYEWQVQMPIIMTYATNNNVSTKEKSVVTLTIVRSNDHEDGIAIESFSL